MTLTRISSHFFFYSWYRTENFQITRKIRQRARLRCVIALIISSLFFISPLLVGSIISVGIIYCSGMTRLLERDYRHYGNSQLIFSRDYIFFHLRTIIDNTATTTGQMHSAGDSFFSMASSVGLQLWADGNWQRRWSRLAFAFFPFQFQ